MDNSSIATVVSVEDFASRLNMEILVKGRGEIPLCTKNISRPGLQLAGYFGHFEARRVQLMGMAEHEYLLGFDKSTAKRKLSAFFEKNVPCLIVSRSLEVSPSTMELAEHFGCPILRSQLTTTQVLNDVYAYLTHVLAPQKTVHGVMMDISGVGILIEGQAGVGKSELALELINRGHRLIADDCVILRLIDDRIVATAPERIRNYMEIRGLGIINVQTLYGPGSVSKEKHVDIVIRLEHWDSNKEYDRIGDEQLSTDVLGVPVFTMLIPVSPGRNIPTIVENAARKYRLKQVGYDAATELINNTLNRL